MEKQKNKKLKMAIVILAILLAVSAVSLAGTLIIRYFSYHEPASVEVPGNIITPESEIGTDTGKADTTDSFQTPSTDNPSDETTSAASSEEKNNSNTPDRTDTPNTSENVSNAETSAPGSENSTKASAISLHSKQPEENTPFQVTNMFPGDNETKYYRIKVNYKGDIIVRHHADIRPGYEKLAEVLKVRIRLLSEDKLLYDGLMRDMPESLNHPLYTTEKTQSELYYEITA